MNTINVNGVTIHYAEEGSGKPVILLHGNGESHGIFSVLIPQLAAAGYHVYAPDTRGHGENEPLEEYHYEDMAEDIYQMIRAWGLERPALYGFSDGGITGILLETTHPGTLGVLAISGTNLSPRGLVPELIEECTGNPDPLYRLMLREPDIDPESLGAIRIPVLMTVGTDDLILPSETEKIREHLPDARLHVYEGESHGSYVIGSPKIGELLVPFLKENY